MEQLKKERSILAAILLKNNNLEIMQSKMFPGDFKNAANKEIYHAMCALNEQRKPIDFISLHRFLKENGAMENIVSTEYLTGLVDINSTSSL